MTPIPLRTWLDGMPPPGKGGPDGSAIVIDVLRATSTIVTALAAQATYVTGVRDVKTAFALKATLEEQGETPLLGGERDGNKLPGFDLGNSPLEYTPERVGGRPLILCTTNGTAALERCHKAKRLFAASFLNAGATAAAVARYADDVTLCCSGKEGAPALEDICCAGLLASLIINKQPYNGDDATSVAITAWRTYKNDVGKLLRTCEHGRYLAALGYEADLAYAARVGALPVTVIRQPDGNLRLENGV